MFYPKISNKYIISERLSFINVHEVGTNDLGVLADLVSRFAFNTMIIVDKSSTQPLSRISYRNKM